LLPLCLSLAPQGRELEPAEPVRPPATLVALAEPAEAAPFPSNAEMAKLARYDPIAFLENCLRRYQAEVHSYSCIMQKRESVNGKLQDWETVQVHFREKPHSVYLCWLDGARLVERCLYVEGENQNMVLARPRLRAARFLVGDVVARDPDSAEAKSAGRYSLRDFGLKKNTERLLNAWKTGRDNNALQTEYLGIHKIKECGDQPCFVLRRVLDRPESENVSEGTYYFYTDNWLLAGSILKGPGGAISGIYYFRDVRLNPELPASQFQRAALTP
jgi:hypothetical protein